MDGLSRPGDSPGLNPDVPEAGHGVNVSNELLVVLFRGHRTEDIRRHVETLLLVDADFVVVAGSDDYMREEEDILPRDVPADRPILIVAKGGSPGAMMESGATCAHRAGCASESLRRGYRFSEVQIWIFEEDRASQVWEAQAMDETGRTLPISNWIKNLVPEFDLSHEVDNFTGFLTPVIDTQLNLDGVCSGSFQTTAAFMRMIEARDRMLDVVRTIKGVHGIWTDDENIDIAVKVTYKRAFDSESGHRSAPDINSALGEDWGFVSRIWYEEFADKEGLVGFETWRYSRRG